jgi:hypothetical protein
MLDSPKFRATPMQIAFLKYVVGQTLTGNAGQIEDYTVVTEVFGRGPNFDQSNDSVVTYRRVDWRKPSRR